MKFRMWALMLVSAAMLFACSPRPSAPSAIQSQGGSLPEGDAAEAVKVEAAPTVQSEVSDNRVAEMEKSLQEQTASAEKASAEKSSLEASVAAMADEVQAMSTQMASAGDEEKAGIESQISALEAEKTATEKKVAELNANDAATQKELAALKAEIEQLKKQLAAAKAGNAVVNNAAAAGAGFYKFYYTGSKCLDVQGSSTADNAPILGFGCAQQNLNQQFVYDLKGNYFFLKSRVSNKCVSSTATTVASPVVQRTCTNTTDKAWQWFGVNGTLGKLRNMYSGKCLGVSSAGRIVQSECNSIYAINFSFFKIQ